MRILIDIGHPAHVHYFRNFISIMQKKGHVFLISARNRPLIQYLLRKYALPFKNRGKGSNSILGKLIYMVHADVLLFVFACRFNPDLFLSFASPYAAQVAWLMRKPHVVMDDTEHAKLSQLFYKPFSSTFLNPSCFYLNFGKKQIFFRSFVECFYLHPDYFQPNDIIYSLLGINKEVEYVIIRLVSWKANHDIGHSGLDDTTKRLLISILEKKYRVFISSEGKLNDKQLAKYELKIPPEFMHDALYYSNFFITESGTMASEAVILNTPVIYINSLPLMGYLQYEQKNGLLFHFKSPNGVIEKAFELMKISNTKNEFKPHNNNLLKNIINPTKFLVWFIENYPVSANVMKEIPDYQNEFL